MTDKKSEFASGSYNLSIAGALARVHTVHNTVRECCSFSRLSTLQPNISIS